MADSVLRDRPQELWLQIETLHLSYLQTEQIPERLDERKKLEGIIAEFISLVPHNRKFRLRETANVLHRSASLSKNFSGYRASSGWNSIALYALNLLSQPWRKEYRELELYCGYFVHEIEANLQGAELMFEEMGYRKNSQMTMEMDWPIDPDRISNVSRDSLVAFVECELLKKIWEDVSRHFVCTWLEILEYRENHVGTWDQAAQGLMYRYHQRQYQEQQQQQLAAYHQDVYSSGRLRQPAACLYGQTTTLPPMPYYSPYPVGYNVPLPSPYPAPIIGLPHQGPYGVHPNYHLPSQPVIKPHDLYPTNGPHPHGYSSTLGNATHQMPYQNGYLPTNHNLQPAQTAMYDGTVPTGQLIELDASAPPHSSSSDTQHLNSTTDSSSSVLLPRSTRPAPAKKSVPEKTRSQKTETEKQKDDGTGTFDNWDYVYRNLESQGYKKDWAERPDVLSQQEDFKTIATLPNLSQELRNNNHQKTSALDLEQTLMEMRWEALTLPQDQPKAMKFNEALSKIRLDGDGEPSKVVPCKGGVNVVDGSESVYDNMSSPPKEKSVGIVPSKSSSMNRSNKATTKTLPREQTRYNNSERDIKYSSSTLEPKRNSDRSKHRTTANRNVSTSDLDNYSKNVDDDYTSKYLGWQDESNAQTVALPSTPYEPSSGKNVDKWACIYCTYHNSPLEDVCQMCHKSKNQGPETRPLVSGGQQCPKCTLVNEKNVDICEACGSSLQDSPTYI